LRLPRSGVLRGLGRCVGGRQDFSRGWTRMNADKAIGFKGRSLQPAGAGSVPLPRCALGRLRFMLERALSAFIRVNPRPMVLLVIALLAPAPAAWAAEGTGGYHVDMREPRAGG